MSEKKLSPRQRKAGMFLLWAYLVYHMRKRPAVQRERACWGLLLEWASLGGKPEEVIT